MVCGEAAELCAEGGVEGGAGRTGGCYKRGGRLWREERVERKATEGNRGDEGCRVASWHLPPPDMLGSAILPWGTLLSPAPPTHPCDPAKMMPA